jgi:hypothetical protein
VGWQRIAPNVITGTLTAIAVGSSSALDLANLKTTDTGYYRAVAEDSARHQFYSEQALVFVNSATPLYYPSVFGQDQDSQNLKTYIGLQQTIGANEGDDVSFPLVTRGEGLHFAWSKAGATLPGSARGISSPTLTLRSVTPGDAGSYTATITADGSTSQVTSVPWTLVVRALPKVLADPQSQSVLPGGKATLSVAASVDLTTTFQWFFRKSGTDFWVPVPGATQGDTSAGNSTCILSPVQKTDEGDYRVELTNAAGTVVSESARVTVYDPAVLTLTANTLVANTLTASTSVNPGGTLVLTTFATGALTDGSLEFYRQRRTTGVWELFATQLSGTLSMTNMTEAQQTAYKVRANGVVNGKVDSAPVSVTVNDPVALVAGTTVKIVALAAGESTAFKVNALGTDVHYEWYFKAATPSSSDWVLQSGTSDTLSLSQVTTSQAGSYGVKIYNGFSSVPSVRATSAPVEIGRLSVNGPPNVSIVSSGAGSLQIGNGGALNLQANVTDTAAGRIYYQWLKDGKAILGASGAVLFLGAGTPASVSFQKSALQFEDAGNYVLLVSNSYGSQLSAAVSVFVNAVPVIRTQPVSMIVTDGGNVTFRTDAIGTGTLAYTWQQQLSTGSWQAVAGGTQSVLALTGVGTLSSASTGVPPVYPYTYRLKVESEFGLTYSDSVTLGVSRQDALKFETAPSLTSGTSTLLSAGSAGLKLAVWVSDKSPTTTLSYSWRKDGKVVFSSGTQRTVAGGSYNVTYALPVVNNDTEGSYDVVVDNGANFSNSTSVALSVDPRIQSFDAPSSVNAGDTTELSVKVRNEVSDPSANGYRYTYTWYRNGVQITTGTADGTTYNGLGTPELTFKAPAAWTTDSQFTVKVQNSAGAASMSDTRTVSVLAPVSIQSITAGPVSVEEGGAISLLVNATGGGEVQYQWLRDGVELSNETQAGLSRVPAALSDAGLYQVRVSNASGSKYSDVVPVTVLAKLGVQLATPDSVPLGGAVNLVSTVTGKRSGDEVLDYQWTLNGKPLANAGTDQYRITSASVLDAGAYQVQVTRVSTGERVLSGLVTLDVKRVPVVQVAPVSRVVVQGSSVNFSVVASSDTAMTYQWSRNGVDISNANASSYRVSNVPLADPVLYTVRITNSAGSVYASAKLTVVNSSAGIVVVPTVGSSGTDYIPTSWWVYWVDATAQLAANNRNGYWLLERSIQTVGGKTTITPGRSIWVWGSASKLMDTPVVYEWASQDQVVQDANASERNEFSVVADRPPAASYTIAGKLEALGEAALFGAPEVLKGAYNGDTEPLSVNMAWDSEQSSTLDMLTKANHTLTEIEETLREALQRELATIAGE